MNIFKQQPGKSLYTDIEWSKPENSNQLGSLFIVGGSANSIFAPSDSYQIACQFGVNTIKIMVPKSAKKNLPTLLPFIEFGATNPSGSFSKESIPEILSYANNSDCLTLCGNFGKNSETAIMLETVLSSYHGLVSICGDGVDYFVEHPKKLLNRPNSVIVATFAQLQKIIKNASSTYALLSTDGQMQTAQKISNFLTNYDSLIITEKDEVIIVVNKNTLVTTRFKNIAENWAVQTATLAGCWGMTNKNNLFKACVTAIAKLNL